MRLHKDYTYLFHDIDRHGVRQNHTHQMLVNDFTALIRFKPDLDNIYELLEDRKDDPFYNTTVYVKQCIFGKNGKHCGLFLTTFIDETNLVKRTCCSLRRRRVCRTKCTGCCSRYTLCR